MAPPLGLLGHERLQLTELLDGAPARADKAMLVGVINFRPKQGFWAGAHREDAVRAIEAAPAPALNSTFERQFNQCWRSAGYGKRGFGFEALAGMLLNVGAITLEDWGGAGEWCHESAALDMRGKRGGNVAWLEIKCGAYNRLETYWTTSVSFSSIEQHVELLSLDPERRSLPEAHLLAARYYGPAADIWSSEEVQLGLFVISGPKFARRMMTGNPNVPAKAWKPAAFGDPNNLGEREAVLAQTSKSTVDLRKGGSVATCDDLMSAFGWAGAARVVIVLPSLQQPPPPPPPMPQPPPPPMPQPPASAAAASEASPLLGRACYLTHLESRPELNGRVVIPLEFDGSSGRFRVVLAAEAAAASDYPSLTVLPAKLLLVPAPREEADGEEERRVDENDDVSYTLASFILEYGEVEGRERWDRSAPA